MASKITKSSELTTALFAAIGEGNLASVKSLLKSGASPNSRGEYGIMPLMRAAQDDHAGIFFALVEAGADLHATRFKDLDSVLNYAVQGETDSRLQMVQAILSDRKFHLAAGFDGPFAMACKNGSPAIVRALLAAGANVNGEYWPLLEATRWNMLDNVRELLAAGADGSARFHKDYHDKKLRNKSALEIAQLLGHSELVKLLKTAGVSLPPKVKKAVPALTVAESWQAIEQWLHENAPGWKALAKGATARQLSAAEASLGLKLPREVRESYELHNGSDERGFFPPADGESDSYALLSLARAVQEWKAWNALLDSGEFAGQRGKAAKGIRSDWWNRKWVPFASNGGGDFYCLDLAPAAGGKVGQIITMNHETGRHRLLASSLVEWLSRFANDLNSGSIKYRKGKGLE